MRNWEIRSRNRFCSSCAGPFEISQVYHTVLDFRKEEPERMDYCVHCWKETNPAADKNGSGIAYWQGHFKRLTPLPEDEGIKKDVIERLLDRYIRSEEEPHVNLCYILALLQERKKILVPRETVTDEAGRKHVVYEHAETGDTYLVRDPVLGLAEVEVVQSQVKELIDQEKAASEQSGEEENGEGEQPGSPLDG